MSRNQISKFIFIFLFTFMGVFTSSAQSNTEQKGDRLYNNNEFAPAIHYYEKELENSDNLDVKRKLANCYIKTLKDTKANHLLESIVNSPDVTAKDYLLYANLLKRLRNYSKAKVWFKKYAVLHPEDKKINSLILSCGLINELEDTQLYTIKSISVNSPQTDFASGFYKNGLAFVSGRKNNTSKEIDGKIGEYYLDMYFSEKSGDHFLKPEPFSNQFNTKYHEGPACFSANEKFIFFTRNEGNLNLEGKSELNLYSARHDGDKWDKAELFQFSGKNYSMAHPSLSRDGRYLYFISNMDGGYGGTDIYVCTKFGFSWSSPINCGSSINTAGNEMFPFIAEDGYLYFASDGHIGFGGLDIFKSIFEQNEWTFPVNLGPPFNTSKDDFGYLIRKNKDLGYFSSNRNGSDDIFEFKQNANKIKNLTGKIIANNSKTDLKDVKIILMENLSKEKINFSDEKGHFSFKIFEGKNYSLIVTKPGFKTKRILYFAQNNENTPKKLNISMDTTQWVKLNGNIIDQYSARAVKKANIQIINQTYRSNSFSISDEYGDFEQDIEPDVSYEIIIQKKGYFTKVINNYTYQSDKFEQIELQKFSTNQDLELYGVEFYSETSELKKNSIQELNNLASLLKVNPHISIEISGFTDQDRGNKENNILCEKRAKVAAEYIISKGITTNRVHYKSSGFDSGRSALVVKLTESF